MVPPAFIACAISECTVTGTARFSYGVVPLREQRGERGFHHLADRLAHTDDSLNSYLITCLDAGFIIRDYTHPHVNVKKNAFSFDSSLRPPLHLSKIYESVR